MMLRIHGSNTIGDDLMPALVKAFLQQEMGYNGVAEDTPRGVKKAKDETYIAGHNDGGDAFIEIFSHGSKTGFEDLRDLKADIWMSSDKIDLEQARALSAKFGDLTGPLGEHVIALDGIAVIVNAANPVSRLSASQLARIFTGSVKSWSEVGGDAGTPHVFARDENSGTWKFFKSEVLTRAGMELTPAARRFEKSEELAHAVESDARGIGFIGLNYVGGNRAVQLSPGNDLKQARPPNVCTVKTEEYVLARRLYLYTSTHPKPIVDRFVRFATSPKAWPIVKNVGLVSTDPSPIAMDDQRRECGGPAEHSPEYVALTKGHRRLLTNFKFLPGKSALDSRSSQDVQYFVDLMAKPQYWGHRILLIGYADQSGAFANNMALSVVRANAVGAVLGHALVGSRVTIGLVAGLGAQDFLRPNDNDANRDKNRRVEAWID